MLVHLDRLRLLVVSIASVVAVTVLPGAASAHTDLDFTTPTDGQTVTEAVDEVVVAFTRPVELVGNGFETLDPQGNLLEPPVLSDDGQTFRLLFDPPLAGGGVGVRYEIRAEDGHILSGSFSFVVDAPVATTAPATSAPAGTSSPATTAPAPDATDPAPPASTTTVASTTTASPTTVGTSTTIATVAAGSGSDGGSGMGVVMAILAAAAVGVGGFFAVRSRTSGVA